MRQSQLLYLFFLSWPMRLNFPQGFAELLKNLIFLESRGTIIFSNEIRHSRLVRGKQSGRGQTWKSPLHIVIVIVSHSPLVPWNYKPAHFYPTKITEKVRLCDGNATIKITLPLFLCHFILLPVLSVPQSKQLFHICSENGNVTFSSNYKSDLSNPLSSSSSNTKIDYGFNFTVPRMAKTPTKLLLDVQHE